MPKKTCRVLITLDCNKDCDYCCNKNGDTLMSILPITLEEIVSGDYDSVVLSGGEPLLQYHKTTEVAQILKMSGKKVYLYTSLWWNKFGTILSHIDGITLSIHNDSFYSQNTVKDLEDIWKLNEGQLPFTKRLWINKDKADGIEVKPSLWDRVVSQSPVPDGACEYPEDNLFLLNHG